MDLTGRTIEVLRVGAVDVSLWVTVAQCGALATLAAIGKERNEYGVFAKESLAYRLDDASYKLRRGSVPSGPVSLELEDAYALQDALARVHDDSFDPAQLPSFTTRDVVEESWAQLASERQAIAEALEEAARLARPKP
jgi:hypothetical protein